MPLRLTAASSPQPVPPNLYMGAATMPAMSIMAAAALVAVIGAVVLAHATTRRRLWSGLAMASSGLAVLVFYFGAILSTG